LNDTDVNNNTGSEPNVAALYIVSFDCGFAVY